MVYLSKLYLYPSAHFLEFILCNWIPAYIVIHTLFACMLCALLPTCLPFSIFSLRFTVSFVCLWRRWTWRVAITLQSNKIHKHSEVCHKNASDCWFIPVCCCFCCCCCWWWWCAELVSRLAVICHSELFKKSPRIYRHPPPIIHQHPFVRLGANHSIYTYGTMIK